MNYAWCGNTNGQLTRISGLANVYTAAGADIGHETSNHRYIDFNLTVIP